MKSLTKPRQLRQALRKGCVMMPGAFNAAVARQIERAGFSAIYVSGAGLANAAAGVPDIGLLSREEVVQLAGYISKAVSIPVLVDADTGFGGPANVKQTMRAFERAGFGGMHIEDQVFPKRCGHLGGKEIVPVDEMTAKIRAAASARRDPDFLIVARTDARAVEGMDAAISRAKKYLAAGADAIFPEAMESLQEFRAFAKHFPGVPLLANLTEFGKSPLVAPRQLAKMGYRLVIFPLTAFRVSMRASEACLQDLKRRGTQRAWLKRMQTRQQLYDLLDYDPAAKTWTRG